MFRRKALSTVVYPSTAVRAYHLPGWKTMSSTKDARTREQREIDRKARQIEKLPKPEALHDFQYPYEKTVLSDYMFQYPVFENELDTPRLFHLTPPPNFFLYWNAADFERTAYPEVPKEDHRVVAPSAQSEKWQQHRDRAVRYLRKHEIVPQYIPHVHHDVNLSVVFPGRYHTRAPAKVDEATGEPIPPPPPETSLTRRNFWFTAHCGNYIELCEVQQPPSIFFVESEDAPKDSLYTFLMFSPDFPYRLPPSAERETTGFFLNYMVANIPGGPQGPVVNEVVHDLSPRKGEEVISYVPPLPTEDAGTTRHICLLIRQAKKVPNVKPLSKADEATHFSLSERADYRLHRVTTQSDLPACLDSLRNVENTLVREPSAATFFQTKWDICVQEFYEAHGLPEPALPLDAQMDLVLDFHSKAPEELRVRARHRPDGSTNIGNEPNFWGQYENTNMMDGSMRSLWSSRTS